MADKLATRQFPGGESSLRMVGGRRSFNVRQQAEAEARRARLVNRLGQAEIHKRGWQASLSRQLGVSRSTITRDLVAIRRIWREQQLAKAEELADWRERIANQLHQCLLGSEGNQ